MNDELLKDLNISDLDLSLPELDLKDIDTLNLGSDKESLANMNEINKDIESIRVNKVDGVISVKFKSIDSFYNAFGCDNEDMLAKGIKDLINFYSHSSNDSNVIQESANYDLSIMNQIKPKDALESIMLKQILMTHNTINKYFLGSVLKDQTAYGKDSNINRVTKLIRSFNSQIQAYIKYSRGGHQKVTVQHVNIGEGGQAIVGNVNNRGGDEKS